MTIKVKDLSDKLDAAVSELKGELKSLNSGIIEMKDEIIKNLMKENKLLNQKVCILEEKLLLQESQTYALDQYTRRNNLEITGIPEDIDDNSLEEKVIEVLGAVDITVDENDIEACHRLPPTKKNSKKKTIVRFVNRKFVETAVHKTSREKLLSCDVNALGFHENTKLFFNENLCPAYRRLAWKCRCLKSSKLIHSTSTHRGSIVIKELNKPRLTKITSDSMLDKLFPNFIYPSL